MDLTVIILTYNEERHIERALSSVSAIASQVFIVDSGSTDRTVEISEKLGAFIFNNKFINQAKQFEWALENTPITTGWVMRLDADEIIESDLVEEIKLKLPILPPSIAGITLNRKHIFMGRWVRHGGRYPLHMLRIWRHGQGRIEDRWMDEHIIIRNGKTTSFNGGFVDHNLSDLTAFIDKHNKYATREAIDVINQKLNLFPRDRVLNIESASFQAAFKRWAKEHIYNQLPFSISATFYFLWRYIFQLGFLDGCPGLIYHFLQGWWYRFLVGAKVVELSQAIDHLDSKVEICAELSRLTGNKLRAEEG